MTVGGTTACSACGDNVPLLRKALDQSKQDGADALQLIQAASQKPSDGRGKIVNTYA